jgi:ribosomal protein L24
LRINYSNIYKREKIMRQKLILLTIFVFLASFYPSAVRAQEAMKPSVVTGEVSAVSASEVVLMTKDGAVSATLSEKTEYKRVSPENPSLKTAVASTFAEIAVGDKVMVTGIMAADKKSIPARAVYLMTKSDIAQKQTKEQEQWRTRGISGKVVAVNQQTKEITVSTRGLLGETRTILKPKDNVKIRRYAQDSVSYSEAKTSSLDEIKVDDFIRALGDKSADGSSFQAEEIVSGAFQNIAGTITAINAAKNEITITNIQTKKSVTVVVGQNSVLKQFPPEMAQRMAALQTGGGGMQPPAGMRPPGNSQPGQTNPPNGMRPNGGGMRGGGGIDEMLERFPTITIADLKVGDMVAFSSTRGANIERVTAIKLLSGVEPFLKAPQAADGSRRGGTDSGFSIPGLEGGGLP